MIKFVYAAQKTIIMIDIEPDLIIPTFNNNFCSLRVIWIKPLIIKILLIIMTLNLALIRLYRLIINLYNYKHNAACKKATHAFYSADRRQYWIEFTATPNLTQVHSIDDFFSWIQHTTEMVVIIYNKSTKSTAQNKLEKVTKFWMGRGDYSVVRPWWETLGKPAPKQEQCCFSSNFIVLV